MKVYVVSRQIDYEPGTVAGVRGTLEEAKALAAAAYREWESLTLDWQNATPGTAYTDQPLEKVWVAPVTFNCLFYPVIEEMEMP